METLGVDMWYLQVSWRLSCPGPHSAAEAPSNKSTRAGITLASCGRYSLTSSWCWELWVVLYVCWSISGPEQQETPPWHTNLLAWSLCWLLCVWLMHWLKFIPLHDTHVDQRTASYASYFLRWMQGYHTSDGRMLEIWNLANQVMHYNNPFSIQH